VRDQTGQRPPVGAPLRHSSSPRTRLLRAGFRNVSRAGALLGDPALAPLLPAGGEADDAERADNVPAHPSTDHARRPGDRLGDVEIGPGREDLIETLALTADPDLALLNLVRLAEAAASVEALRRASTHDVEPGCARAPADLPRSLMIAPAPR